MALFPELNPDYWEQRYQAGSDRWDIGQAAPPFRVIAQAFQKQQTSGTMAVLGCGRGYDALLFAEAGLTVTGFDFSPTAIRQARALAQQQGLAITYVQRDIFTLNTEFHQHFDYVLEHTCFCAIAPNQRQDYVTLVHHILRPGGRLIALFFTHNRPGGPPYGCQVAELSSRFSPKFDLISLDLAPNSIPSRQGEEHLAIFQR
ncbi:MAG: methyltransferase domain-containing protein [Oscillatoriales cyanobacterium SM2_2_1]|nr:methyltransferase domain-containing protein [Oscillatoriales cyanobacterium SM2_2_1]